MPESRDRKLYLGPRLRMLRRELGLSQTQMAAELAVSPSYLNHLERNQRPLTAQMLLRLADTYDLDVRGFVAGANDAASSGLHEVFADELVRDVGIARQEVLDVAENYPNVAAAVARLYRALTDLRQLPQRVAGEPAAPIASPLAWVRQWLETRRNHFTELDAAAEALSSTFGEEPAALRQGATMRLEEAHGIGVRIVAPDVLAGALWHYDFHRRRLLLSQRSSDSERRFAVLRQLARSDLADPIAAALDAAAAPDGETRALALAAIVNYAAAALAMPYARFHAAAGASRYDVDLLAAMFGASWEQVAHRLTSLERPSARGVELFLLKLDVAGNVVKRYAGAAAPLARFGGGCPRWRVHGGFARPGETIVDRIVFPDGGTYLTWARAQRRGAGAAPTLLILGCEAKDAGSIGYGDAVGTATPVGPACHLCERVDCPDRSLPPITRALDPDPNRRGTPYPFRLI